MRKWINLLEALSDIAVEKTSDRVGDAIEASIVKARAHSVNKRYLDAVNKNGVAIKYIENPSEEAQLAAVK